MFHYVKPVRFAVQGDSSEALLTLNLEKKYFSETLPESHISWNKDLMQCHFEYKSDSTVSQIILKICDCNENYMWC